jgi:C1A family cysteine protease
MKRKVLALFSAPVLTTVLPPGRRLEAIPSEFDWRDLNKVTPVKNGARGESWAYATVSSIESKFAIDYEGEKFKYNHEDEVGESG